MRINWRAIAAGLAGGLLAAYLGTYATTKIIDPTAGSYTGGDLLRAGAVVALGGIVATVLGWALNGRRDAGRTGIAALVSLVGAVGTAYAWAGQAGSGESQVTLLFLVMGAVLVLGAMLLALAAVSGTTVAVLRPASARVEQR